MWCIVYSAQYISVLLFLYLKRNRNVSFKIVLIYEVGIEKVFWNVAVFTFTIGKNKSRNSIPKSCM